MGDAQLSREPTRNVIVSSTPTSGGEEHIAPGQQPSAITPTTVHSTTGHYPTLQASGNSIMAVPIVQQPYAAQQPRFTQHSNITAPYMQQRAVSVGHGAPQPMFNGVGMQRALTVYPQLQQQASQAPQVHLHNQQQRFQTGPSLSEVTYQLSQQQHLQLQGAASAGAPGSGQCYHVPGFQQPFFDPYTQHASTQQGQQDSQAQQQQQQSTFYSTNYPLQYPQSAGPTQAHFATPQWFGPQTGFYYFPPAFVGSQFPSQHMPQIASQQHVSVTPYDRRHSVPARGSLPKRRGSETDAVFNGYPGATQWDGRGLNEYSLRSYGQPSRGPSGENSGVTTNAVTPGTYDTISSPSSLHPGMPRGPPRKPKQSGHALWVGNLPAGTQVIDLKDYFSREARNDIESVFLISKSNCAFVNYRTEKACNEAMTRFHDSRFQNTRLVCRLRRNSAASTVGAATPSPDPSADQSAQASGDEGNKEGEVLTDNTKSPPIGPGGARAPLRETGRDRIFIVKSLTVEDLDLSVRNGIWATQNHNETTLNQAFETADNVYLIFSANKSGEYYGYARMTSPILEDSSDVIELAPSTQQIDDLDLPKAIYTPATENAPQGRIIDDSARGTIFWEALSDDGTTEDDSREKSQSDNEDKATVVSKSWGKPFRVEWLSTSRVPFYRTRGLRNPLNANREVKIARDGTELEETAGKRLIQMFRGSNSGTMQSAISGSQVGLMATPPMPNRGNTASH